LIFAYGSALTSLGLTLATWVSRPGRATAWCVIAVVFMTIVPVVVGAFMTGYDPARGFAWFGVASPFWGTGATSAMINVPFNGDFRDAIFWSGVVWTAAYLGLAVLLHALTLASFDRCLGRVRQGDRRQVAPGQRRQRI
jgi:hypothetical protein